MAPLSDDQLKKNSLELSRLRKIRKNLRHKRPTFRRLESWRYKRIKDKWRRSRGIDSKTREKKGGWPVSPSVGFRSPKKVRDQTRSGKEPVIIRSVADLSLLDPNLQVGYIDGTIGRRKKEKIIVEAELLNVRILNPITTKVDLGDLEEELELDEELLEDIGIEDLELTNNDESGEEE